MDCPRRFDFQLAILLVILAAFLGACGGHGSIRDENSASSAPVGDITLPDLEGRRVRLADFRGKVVWLAFWATWCEPCRTELSYLQKLWLELRQRGFELVSICVDSADDQNLVRQQARQDGYRFPVLLDHKARLSERLNPGLVLPFGMLLDRRGRTVHIQRGFYPEDERLIRERIEAILVD